MAHKRKGQFAICNEWAKHLRSDGKRRFHKKERAAGKRAINEKLK